MRSMRKGSKEGLAVVIAQEILLLVKALLVPECQVLIGVRVIPLEQAIGCFAKE